MNDSLLKLELDNLQELLRLKDLNQELLETNYILMNRLIEDYKKEGKTIPVEIEGLLGRIGQILRRIQSEPTPTEILQGRRPTADWTEPKEG